MAWSSIKTWNRGVSEIRPSAFSQMWFCSLSRLMLVASLAVTQALAAANSLQEVTGFGTNPTNVRMFTYKPTGLVSKPALIVAMHYCTGTAAAYFGGTQYANLADSYKTFMVIYPQAPDSGGCWDVHTTQTLTHDAGGDSRGIASMVRYAILTYGVDASRVFMTGSSSGAMMTNVLAGAYPDLFAAGVAFSGVPYACFAGSSLWNSACAQGTLTKTAQQWVSSIHPRLCAHVQIDIYRAILSELDTQGILEPAQRCKFGMAPSKYRISARVNFHSPYIMHQPLFSDQTLSYNNFNEAVKEWTNVFGYSISGAPSVANSPKSGWTRTTYGPRFEAISAQGVGHDLPLQENDALAWFGLKGGSSTTTSSVSTTKPVSTTKTTTSSGSVATGTQSQWGQCGGYVSVNMLVCRDFFLTQLILFSTGWTGPTVCASPYKCTFSNNYYSQVRPCSAPRRH